MLYQWKSSYCTFLSESVNQFGVVSGEEGLDWESLSESSMFCLRIRVQIMNQLGVVSLDEGSYCESLSESVYQFCSVRV